MVLALALPVGAGLYSAVGPHSVWDTRQLAASTPGLALAVATLLTSTGPRLQLLAVALVVAGLGIGATRMLGSGVQRPDYDAAAAYIDRVGASGEPVLDLPAPTPRPLTALDVAFAGSASSERRPIYRIGLPSRAAMLAGRPYAPLAVPPTSALVRRALGRARDGRLFVVVPAEDGYGRGLADATVRPGANDLREVASATFPGIAPVSVYEYGRDARPPAGAG